MDSGRSPSLVETGWQQLDEGRWEAAARCFDEALDLTPDDARALEGSAWAGWWLSDADRLRLHRERAFQAYQDLGEHVAAARTAIWLGCDHHEIWGEHAIANGWYQRARRLLADLPTTAEHAWLSFHIGAYALELADDTETAIARAAEAVEIARSLSLNDVVFLSLALEGLALVTRGDVDDGMRCLDEASAAATSGELRDRIATTWTLCYLIYACERVRDFDRTTQWCRKMESVAADFGFQAGVGICRVHYAGVLVFHGEWERAEVELHRSRGVFAAVRPFAVPESDVRLGELRRRQGRVDEANDLFAQSVPHPLARLGLAGMALDRGDPGEAVEHVRDLIATTPAGSVTQLADALGLLATASAEAGDVETARHAAARLDDVAARIRNRPLQAMAAAANGAVAAALGDHGAARWRFESAAALFEQGGLPYEAACARGELAAALGRLGRVDDARSEAATAVRQLLALGAVDAAARIERRLGIAPVPSGPAPLGLTTREAEILGLLAGGLKDREIAQRLTISPHTVHRHVSNIRTKLGVPSRAAAVAYGVRHGIGHSPGSGSTVAGRPPG